MGSVLNPNSTPSETYTITTSAQHSLLTRGTRATELYYLVRTDCGKNGKRNETGNINVRYLISVSMYT